MEIDDLEIRNVINVMEHYSTKFKVMHFGTMSNNLKH